MQKVLVPDLFSHAQQGELPWRLPTTASLLLTSMEALQAIGKDGLINQGAAISRASSDQALHDIFSSIYPKAW